MSDSATAPAHLPSDRRSFLAAGLGTIAAIGATALPVAALAQPDANRAAWDTAIASYEQANAAVLHYDQYRLTPECGRLERLREIKDRLGDDASRAAHAKAFEEFELIEAHFDQIANRRYDAIDRVGKTPAPDFSALKRKIDILVDDARWECRDMGDLFKVIQTDFTRLLDAA